MKEWRIPAGGEFRFEVDFGKTVTIKLATGNAEVFGAELAPEREYSFSGQKLAIFSFDGATVSVLSGECSVEYVSSESVAVPSYLALHADLEKERMKANGDAAPRVLIVGPGRNSLVRTLVNYSVRQNGRPIWASLDVRTNPLFFPGIVSAHSINAPVEAEDISMAGAVLSENGSAPLTLFFGSTSISDNRKLWLKMAEQLASSVGNRLSLVPENGKAGCVVVGPSDQELEQSFALVEDIQRMFSINWIVVVGNERSHARLQRHFASVPSIRVTKQPKSGGGVNWPRPGDWDDRHVRRLYNSYFYGPKHELNPFSQQITDFSLYRILLGEEDIAPMSALPLGATRKLDECRAVRVEPSSSLLLYSIVAVLYAADAVSKPAAADQSAAATAAATPKRKDDSLTDALIRGSIAGYMYVTGVDEQRKAITVLSPCPGDPPSRTLLCGRLKWIE